MVGNRGVLRGTDKSEKRDIEAGCRRETGRERLQREKGAGELAEHVPCARGPYQGVSRETLPGGPKTPRGPVRPLQPDKPRSHLGAHQGPEIMERRARIRRSRGDFPGVSLPQEPYEPA